MRRRLAAIAALALGAPAAAADDLPTIDSANPPTLRVTARDALHVDRIAVDRGAVTRLHVSATSSGSGAAELVIDLPTGSRVLGFQLGDRLGRPVAVSVEAPDADGARELGVLATATWAGTSADEDHVVVRLASPRRGRVELHLAVALPALARVMLEPAHLLVADGASTAQRVTRPAGAHLDADTALVVAGAIPTVAISSPSQPISCEFGTRWLRRAFRDHAAQLRQCYMASAQRDPSLEGEAVLHVRIARSGAVDRVTVDDGIDPTGSSAIATCLAAEVRSWTFAASNADAQVTYPLRFRLRR